MKVTHYLSFPVTTLFSKRWTFLFLCSIFSITTSFIPFSYKGERVLVSSSPTHQSTIATPLENARKQALSRYTQIKELGVGQKKLVIPTATPTPLLQKSQEWGKAVQIDEHTWTMQVKNDEKQGTPQEILQALNSYRQKHGKGSLSWDSSLANYAHSRANEFSQKGTLDGHKGFMDFMNNQDGFSKLGFSSLGENSSYGYTLEGVHLIEWVYAADKPHDDNQLNSEWTHVGVGVVGVATNLVFGGKKR